MDGRQHERPVRGTCSAPWTSSRKYHLRQPEERPADVRRSALQPRRVDVDGGPAAAGSTLAARGRPPASDAGPSPPGRLPPGSGAALWSVIVAILPASSSTISSTVMSLVSSSTAPSARVSGAVVAPWSSASRRAMSAATVS